MTMTLQEEGVPALGLLMALARADGPLNAEELEILYAFLEALRLGMGLDAAREEDELLLGELAGWMATARSIQSNGVALHETTHAKTIFPQFLAAMAIADGLPNDKERIMIGRIKAGLRSAT